jgi:hypothetical protein
MEKIFGASNKKKVYNTDNYIQSKSYFQRPQDEIKMIFKAI